MAVSVLPSSSLSPSHSYFIHPNICHKVESRNLIRHRMFWTSLVKINSQLSSSVKHLHFLSTGRLHSKICVDITDAWIHKTCRFGSITFMPQAFEDLRLFERANALPLRKHSSTNIDDELPRSGSVVFRRNVSEKRIECYTTLERVGLTKVSSDQSRSMAFALGLSDSSKESGTPVGILMDIMKEGRDFRLRGTVKTVLALCCNRCLAPTAEPIAGDFDLLLTEKPVVQPAEPSIGVVLGADKKRTAEELREVGELDLDLDDKLHFPRNAKEVDISTYIHDTIHLEIPAKSLCNISCKGLCLDCGVNLNSIACRCAKKKAKPEWEVLDKFKEQME